MSKNILVAILAVACLTAGSAAYIAITHSPNGPDEGVAEYEPGYPRTVTDFYGNQITLNECPKRVIAHGMEFLVYLGPDIVDRVIWTAAPRGGMDADPLYDMFDLSGVATASGAMISMADMMISKRPDLVLMGDSKTDAKTRENFRSILAEAGINVFFYTNQSNLFSNSKECIEVNLIPIAKIFNKEDRAKELYDYVVSVTDDLDSRLSAIDTGSVKNAYAAGGAGKQRPNFLGSSANTYFPLMYLDSCVHNVMKDLAPDVEHTKFADFEKLYQFESEKGPIDYIFVSQSCWADFRDLWDADSSRFEALEAFKTGDVYFVMDWFPRSTNPLICAYAMAAQLFPEQFADFDLRELIEDTFEKFYGFEGAGAKAYGLLVQKTQDTTGQGIGIFGRIDQTKL